MITYKTRRTATLVAAALAATAAGAVTAQEAAVAPAAVDTINVQGNIPSDLAGMPKGPEVAGLISARDGNRIQVTAADGTNTTISISEATEVRGRGGFLGLNRTALGADALLNGLPVTVETVQWSEGLIASRIRLKSNDLQTAAMIRTGTSQKFAEHGAAISQNAAATEALRGRMGDIDQYNLKGTTSVFFDTGKWQLSADAQRQLCDTARQAEAMDNALLLVVGYTDAVGDEDYNQELSEKRAGRVVNFLQQQCRWAPYRMLTPTGMAEADPMASNDDESGRAQNRRVSVNILVSKAVEGI